MTIEQMKQHIQQQMNQYISNKLGFENIVIEGNTAWFFITANNFLVEADLSAKTLKVLGSVPNEAPNGVRLYSGIEKYKDFLILIPMAAKEIAIYDLVKKQFAKIEIQLPDIVPDRYLETHKFFAHCIYKDTCYMIGHCYPGILCFNLETFQQTVLDHWVEPIEKKAQDPQKGYFMDEFILNGNMLVIPSCIANIALLLDLDTKETMLDEIGEEGNYYYNICYDGQFYWLLDHKEMKNRLIKWEKGTGYLEAIDMPESCNGFYKAMRLNGKKIDFFPYSVSTAAVSYDTALKVFQTNGLKDSFTCIYPLKNKIVACSNSNNTIEIISPETMEVEQLLFADADGSVLSAYLQMKTEEWSFKQYIVEAKPDEILTLLLNSYIGDSQKKDFMEEQTLEKGKYGDAIYKYVKAKIYGG